MNIKEIREELESYKWMRPCLDSNMIDAILLLLDRVEELEAKQEAMRYLINPPPPMLIAKNIQIAKDGKFDGGDGAS